MAKPRLIIVVRHAQSEGNKNRDIHQTIPDHRVKLTSDGWNQAHEAGRRLRAMLREDDTLHFFTSPYRRTRETTEGILSTLTSDEPEPSPFKRDNIKVYEEPRLREQDFGNFQPCSAEMERMWQERADYGHFFYRIPNGESAADAYDRVSGFNESLWRQFGEDDFASVCVLVTHGLMSRVFLMKWYHFTVEYFEDLRNVNHCEFLIMRKQEDSGKYVLENQLRTWSELRRERQEQVEEQHQKESSKLSRTKTFVPLRRWGGCPNGCDHSRHFKPRDDLEMLRMKDTHISNKMTGASGSKEGSIVNRRSNKNKLAYNSDDDAARSPDAELGDGPQIDVTRACEEVVSSPDGTPSFISAEDRLRALKSPHFLHIGRDGGGTYSGHASVIGSEDELSAEEDHRPTPSKSPLRSNGNGHVTSVKSQGTWTPPDAEDVEKKTQEYVDESGMGRGAKANRLGDHSRSNSDKGSDGTSRDGDVDADTTDIDKAEKADRSIMGSIY